MSRRKRARVGQGSNQGGVPNNLPQIQFAPPGGGGGGGGGRAAIHAQWNNAAVQGIHWDLGHGGFAPGTQLTGIPIMDIAHDVRPGDYTDGKYYTWLPEPSVVTAADPPFMTALPENPNMPFPIHPHRNLELNALWERGNIMTNFLVPGWDPNPGGVKTIEPRWAFCGIDEDQEFTACGPGWSVFKYILSDLITDEGHMTGVDLCATLRDVLCDILAIGNPYITRATRIMIYFSGEFSDPAQHGGGKPWMFYNPKALTLGFAFDHPDVIIAHIAEKINQAHNSGSEFLDEFQFYRVFIPCLTRLNLHGGGGNLSLMPEAMKQLRDSDLYSGKKGYIKIENDDNMCGFYALLAGLANVVSRIKKAFNVINSEAPEICKKLVRFKDKIDKRTAKGKRVQSEILLEMQSCIGWKKDQVLTPEDLCIITRHLRSFYKIDIGLLIFDAVYPLKEIIASYDPRETLPSEKICLIKWTYGDQNLMGHYDCIYATNLVSWIQKGVKNRQHLVFCYRSLRMVRNNETTEKGALCLNCNFYEKEIKLKTGLWQNHGPALSTPTYLCQDCNVYFKSTECYDLHKQKSHGLAKTACESRRKCISCGKVHGEEYDCSSFFCQVCKKKFKKEKTQKHVCYIQNSSKRVRTRLEHVVYADCEGSRRKGYHTAVCIAAAWVGLCDEHKKYTKKRCEVCKEGEQEFGSFCSQCLDDYDIKKCSECSRRRNIFFMSENCVDEFLDWLEENFKKVTVVFHNGGRYDMHLIYNELLKSGKFFIKKEAERGTQILFMVASLLTEERKQKSVEIRFIDSFNFIASSLRNFPNMFTIDKKLLSKGRFPYELLNQENWIEYRGPCPDYGMFGITQQEFNNVSKLSLGRQKDIKETLEYIKEQKDLKEEWIARDKIKEYTLQDVFVLQAGCEDFRYNFWRLCKTDPFHWVTLAAAVAGTYRQERFMPSESIQVFGMEEREWQRRGLRGGRCEPFKLYWRASHEHEEMKIYDVNSEYPAAQTYAFAPVGPITCDKSYDPPKPLKEVALLIYKNYGANIVKALMDPTGESGNGIIECTIRSAFSPFPILPYKDEKLNKNLFMVRDGPWIGFICLLAEAITHNQVIVTNVKRIQFWQKTTDKLFRDFLPPIYASKVHATGWKKILGTSRDPTEEQIKNFILESKDRGIFIDEKQVKENPGLRSTSKVMVNCGWGYMCQKPHATDILYFDNSSHNEIEEMAEVLMNLESDKDSRRLTGIPKGIGKFTRLKLTKEPLAISKKEMNANIAYHVGGIAPAWGLQLLSRSLLLLHTTQPAYCDTDSIFYVYDRTHTQHKLLPTGPYLGDFVDEYPEHRIVEYVCVGPKSYWIKLVHRKTGKIEFKGKFKGLPMLSSSFSLLDEKEDIAEFGMKQMKAILFSAYPNGDEDVDSISFQFHYTNFFKRNPDLKIREAKEKKTVRFTFDKRKVLWPDTRNTDLWTEINTVPLTDSDLQVDIEAVKDYWDELNKLFY